MHNQTVLYITLSSFEVTPMYFAINIIIIMAALIAIVLNAGIIYIILVEKEFDQDVPCILIKHLTVSDLICAVLIIYTVTYNLVHYKVFMECLIRFGLLNGIFLNSSMLIFALTVDRYIKIISPYKYLQVFTPARASKAVFINWIVCVFLCLLPLFGWYDQRPSNHCSFFGFFPTTYRIVYAMTILTSVFLIIVMYIHIMTIAITQQMNTFFQRPVSEGHSSAWWRPTKTTLFIVGTNIITVVPPSK